MINKLKQPDGLNGNVANSTVQLHVRRKQETAKIDSCCFVLLTQITIKKKHLKSGPTGASSHSPRVILH